MVHPGCEKLESRTFVACVFVRLCPVTCRDVEMFMCIWVSRVVLSAHVLSDEGVCRYISHHLVWWAGLYTEIKWLPHSMYCYIIIVIWFSSFLDFDLIVVSITAFVWLAWIQMICSLCFRIHCYWFVQILPVMTIVHCRWKNLLPHWTCWDNLDWLLIQLIIDSTAN